uniref:Mex-3 RNA binding family member D n=1 Tax=Nomascus leucogenys TaxID=61853 RepID=G1QM95_NOMLE
GAPPTLAPAVAAAPGSLPLLDPNASPPPPPPPPPRPSPPDVFAGFAPHPAALGPQTLLADQMSVIGSRKKSVNMTECVPVPSSEHVAEIVGRQGCKIKALRAKTNTYIKTPVRGEEPVFIVTGRKEDVEMAKREILSAAEHFSIIRATRSKAGGLPGTAQGPPNLPGQTTIQVRVPYRVVGAGGGAQGVPGAPVGTAAPDDCDFGFDFLALDLTVPAAATIWAPFERAAPLPAFSGCSTVNGAPGPAAAGARRSSGAGTPRHSPTLPEPGGLRLELPLSRRGAPDPVGALSWRPPQGPVSFPGGAAFSTATSLPSSPAAAACAPLDSGASENSRKPPSASSAPALARECVVCAEGEVMAALVPCGHNLFCMDCAVRICGKSEPECPACRTPATQAIHIFS